MEIKYNSKNKTGNGNSKIEVMKIPKEKKQPFLAEFQMDFVIEATALRQSVPLAVPLLTSSCTALYQQLYRPLSETVPVTVPPFTITRNCTGLYHLICLVPVADNS